MKTKKMITVAALAMILGSFSVNYAAVKNTKTVKNIAKTTKAAKLVESNDYTCGDNTLKVDFFEPSRKRR